MKYNVDLLVELSDGIRTSEEIAEIVECPKKYVQKMWVKLGLPRPKQGPPVGERNPSWGCGRKIDLDGYAWLNVPTGVPRAIYRKDREFGTIREHHLVVMKKLGRKLRDGEVVDHLDGLKLHNHPENLRVFQSNADHLKATLTGKVPRWSEEGVQVLNSLKRGEDGRLLSLDRPRVDKHRHDRVKGVLRLQQIRLVRERLGTDSPFLLGTHKYLDSSEIHLFQTTGSGPTLKCLLSACDLLLPSGSMWIP